MSGFGATGSYAIGASGPGSTPVEVSAVDSFSLTSLGEGALLALLQDMLGLSGTVLGGHISALIADLGCSDNATAEPLRVLLASLGLVAETAPMTEAKVHPEDGARFTSALGAAWRMLLQEDLVLTGTIAANATRLAAAIDVLHATGVASSRNEAKALVASVVALHGLVSSGWAASAADSVTFQPVLQNAIQAATKLVASLSWGDTVAPQIHITAVMADDMAVSEEATATLEALANASDGVLLHASLRLGDDEYVGWVLNEGAPSQYTNYPFNGLSAFGNCYVGTKDDGIYLLEGDDDHGEPIEARIKTALMDFGAGVNKRIPDVYVAFAGGNKLVCKVVTVHPRTGQKTEAVYETTLPPGSEMHNGRIKLGQRLESRYWQFTLANVDGASFDIDELTFRPLFLDRRL